ncbi:MAG: hypothetical protein JXR36_11680, partial [Bacteroidales bacterium]|nr:hypothetical protein [Bacteroidales bacterium]
HEIKVTAKNDCGNDEESTGVEVAVPCFPPKLTMSVSEIANSDFSHQIVGKATNIKSKSQISLKIDGVSNSNFAFTKSTGRISANIKLDPGTHVIILTIKNDCGEDSMTESVIVEEPCIAPTVNVNISEINEPNYTHQLIGNTTNLDNRNQIKIRVDGNIDNSFEFDENTGKITAKFKLAPDNHSIIVDVTNDCGTDRDGNEVTVAAPCVAPKIDIKVVETTDANYTHKLTGAVTNISAKSGITLKIDGNIISNFTFDANSGQISAMLNLSPGTHSVIATAVNECGTDTDGTEVVVIEEACGPRINPGNADWEFCLITPSGTFNRSSLSNSDFSYSGPASSIFFKATAGGGDAIVNGNPYTISSGKYYLFKGSLQVNVSTSNPGSMGLWSVCIEANREPTSGVGNNRPNSPCEEEEDEEINKEDKNITPIDGGNEIRVNDRNNKPSVTPPSGRENSDDNNNQINVSGSRNNRTATPTNTTIQPSNRQE